MKLLYHRAHEPERYPVEQQRVKEKESTNIKHNAVKRKIQVAFILLVLLSSAAENKKIYSAANHLTKKKQMQSLLNLFQNTLQLMEGAKGRLKDHNIKT